MTQISGDGPRKLRGRPPGAPNKITRDIRAALRELAEGNAERVQSWLDSVAETDPAEALRLWLALLRYVTPTLQAAAIADLTLAKSTKDRLLHMTDADDIAIFQHALPRHAAAIDLRAGEAAAIADEQAAILIPIDPGMQAGDGRFGDDNPVGRQSADQHAPGEPAA